MRFTTCDCRTEHYRRVRRSGWMRLISSRRLYHCLCCDAMLFIRQDDAVGSPFRDTVPVDPAAHEESGRRPSAA